MGVSIYLAHLVMFDNRLTKSVEFIEHINKILAMSGEKYVNVREFLRNYKELSGTKKVIVISNNGKPEGVYLPYEKWKKSEKKPKEKGFILTPEVLKKYTFSSGIKNLSEQVDEIVYQDIIKNNGNDTD